jgi:glycopeptide antibiotics resistance protein
MLKIYYSPLVMVISILWVLFRIHAFRKTKQISIVRELELILVYICIVVVARFTFFPFSKVNGRIQPLLFDAARILPFRINLSPFVNLFDYESRREALLNLIGNTAMFVPLGIVWPAVFKKLNTHLKVMFAGFGVSLTIEVLQLPFFGRSTDIDDLVLNTLGFLLGYGIYLLVKRLGRKRAC